MFLPYRFVGGMLEGMIKESPINPAHARHGASMGTEEGWNMPQQFSNLIDEHLAARSSCGIFDISHVAKISVCGTGSQPWLESMLSNSIATCTDGSGQRTLMLRERGTIIDKFTLFRESSECFFLLGSASMSEEDFDWLSNHRPDGPILLRNETEVWSAMAVYGPDSEKVFSRVLRGLDMPEPMRFLRVTFQNEELLLTRSNMIGGESFELFCPASSGISWYESFITAGAIPCGMGARECIRLEHASPAIGRDLGPDKTPIQAGLGRFCDLSKTFTGVEALRRQRQHGVPRHMAALSCVQESDRPRTGDQVIDNHGDTVGQVTSGCISPANGHGLALAYLAGSMAHPGTHVYIIMHGHTVPAVVLERALI